MNIAIAMYLQKLTHIQKKNIYYNNKHLHKNDIISYKSERAK